MTDKNKSWLAAQKKYHLSEAHVRMAKELGMNPQKLGGMANSGQEKWKVPLASFIEEIFYKRLKKRKK